MEETITNIFITYKKCLLFIPISFIFFNNFFKASIILNSETKIQNYSLINNISQTKIRTIINSKINIIKSIDI